MLHGDTKKITILDNCKYLKIYIPLLDFKYCGYSIFFCSCFKLIVVKSKAQYHAKGTEYRAKCIQI